MEQRDFLLRTFTFVEKTRLSWFPRLSGPDVNPMAEAPLELIARPKGCQYNSSAMTEKIICVVRAPVNFVVTLFDCCFLFPSLRFLLSGALKASLLSRCSFTLHSLYTTSSVSGVP
jgi:hypothetical protein